MFGLVVLLQLIRYLTFVIKTRLRVEINAGITTLDLDEFMSWTCNGAFLVVKYRTINESNM